MQNILTQAVRILTLSVIINFTRTFYLFSKPHAKNGPTVKIINSKPMKSF